MVLAVYRDPHFLDSATCRHVRRAMDVGRPDAAEVLAASIELREDTRRAVSIEIDEDVTGDIEERIEAQREAIASFFGISLGGREGTGFLRYRDGGFYAPHRDRAASASWPDAARRGVAVVVFLNGSRVTTREGDFDGGTLRLYGDAGTVTADPAEGLLVAFRADLLHEVTTVRGGARDVAVDWFYDR